MEDIPGVAEVTQDNLSLTGWALAGVGTVVSVLATSVAYLFKLRENENSKAIGKLETDLEEMTRKADDCHRERAEIKAKCESNSVRIEFLTKEIEALKIRGAP